LKPAAGVVAAEAAAGVAVVVSHAEVQRRAVASHRGRQLAGHRGRKPTDNKLVTVIEIVEIGRVLVTMHAMIVGITQTMPVKIVRITLTMCVKIARITTMTGGMTTMIIVIMVVLL
jgi:hypothetical protein